MLVTKLKSVSIEPLKRVALEHLHPQAKPLDSEPNEIWKMLGGDEDIRRMRRNAHILAVLAAYVQCWNFTSPIVVVEKIPSRCAAAEALVVLD